MLAACGGGEGAGAAGSGSAQTLSSGGTTETSPSAQPLSMRFGSCPFGAPVRVHLSDSVRVSALVRGGDGTALPDVLVTFTAPTNASLVPALGTALTGADGIATVRLQPNALGAATLSAAASVEGAQRTASVAFDVVAPGAERTACALN